MNKFLHMLNESLVKNTEKFESHTVVNDRVIVTDDFRHAANFVDSSEHNTIVVMLEPNDTAVIYRVGSNVVVDGNLPCIASYVNEYLSTPAF